MQKQIGDEIKREKKGQRNGGEEADEKGDK
jgi:hypothetical protein